MLALAISALAAARPGDGAAGGRPVAPAAALWRGASSTAYCAPTPPVAPAAVLGGPSPGLGSLFRGVCALAARPDIEGSGRDTSRRSSAHAYTPSK